MTLFVLYVPTRPEIDGIKGSLFMHSLIYLECEAYYIQVTVATFSTFDNFCHVKRVASFVASQNRGRIGKLNEKKYFGNYQNIEVK